MIIADPDNDHPDLTRGRPPCTQNDTGLGGMYEDPFTKLCENKSLERLQLFRSESTRVLFISKL